MNVRVMLPWLMVLSALHLAGCMSEFNPGEETERAGFTAEPSFSPLPYQDTVKGRNSNAYLPALDRPTDGDRRAFVARLKQLAISAQVEHGVPACLVGGMAVVEGGYGFTRLAYFANNLFAMKYWNAKDPSGATSGVSTWQLKGQPDEAWDGSVRTVQSYGADRLVFDESKRYDNRYRAFEDHGSAVGYLAGVVLQSKSRRPYVDNYWINIKSGMAIVEACKRMAFELAAPSKPNVVYDSKGADEYYQVTWYDSEGKRHNGGGAYCHLGGTHYRKVIGGAIDTWGLQGWNAEATTVP